MKKTQVNTLTGGMNSDMDSLFLPENAYISAVNMVINSIHHIGLIESEEGNFPEYSLSSDATVTTQIIGSTTLDSLMILFVIANSPGDPTIKDFIIIIDKNSGTVSPIYLSKTADSPIFSTNIDLGFDINYRVKAESRYLYNGDIGLYFTDNHNPIGYLRIKYNTSGIYVNKYTALLESISSSSKQPQIDISMVESGGLISCSSYLFAIVYIDSTGQVIDYSDFTNPYPVVDDVIANPTYDGAYNTIKAPKSFQLTLHEDSFDSKFDTFKIALITYVGIDNTPTAYLLDNIYSKSFTGGLMLINISGSESSTQISLADAILNNADYKYAKEIAQLHNRLLFANLRKEIFSIDFALIASKITLGLTYESKNNNAVSYDGSADGGMAGYRDGHVSEEERSYQRNEVYSFGAVFVIDGTTETSVYHIPAPDLDKNNSDIFPGQKTFLNPSDEFSFGTYFAQHEYKDQDPCISTNTLGGGKKVRYHVVPNYQVTEALSGDGTGYPYTQNIILNKVVATNLASVLSTYIDPVFLPRITDIKFVRRLRDSNSNKTITAQGVAVALGPYPGLVNRDGNTVYITKGSAANANGVKFTDAYLGQSGDVSGGNIVIAGPGRYPQWGYWGHSKQFILSSDGSDCSFGGKYPIVGPEYKFTVKKNVLAFLSPEFTFGVYDQLVGYLQPIRKTQFITTVKADFDFNSSVNWPAGGNGSGDNKIYGLHAGESIETSVVQSLIQQYTPSLTKMLIRKSQFVDSTNDVSILGDTSIKSVWPSGEYMAVEIDPAISLTNFRTNINEFKLPDEGQTEDYLITNIYNGNINCYGSLYGSEYISVGKFGVPDIVNNIITPVFSNGDTFITRFSHLCQTAYSLIVSAENRRQGTMSAVGFYVESQYNAEFRHVAQSGSIQAPGYIKWFTNTFFTNFRNPLGAMPPTGITYPCWGLNSSTYNSAYSKENNFNINVTESQNTDQVFEYPNRIAYSDLSVQGETSDRYRIFRVNNYKDIPSHRGPIWNLFSFNNDIYAHCTSSLFKTFMQQTTAITASNSVQVTLGVGSLFGLPEEEMVTVSGGYGGIQDSFGGVNTPYGRFFVDRSQGKVFNLGQNLSEISLEHQMYQFFLNNSRFSDTVSNFNTDDQFINPSGHGVGIGYDSRNKRILITRRGGVDSKDFTISYSFVNGKFASLHGYKPTFFVNSGLELYTVDNARLGKDLWIHYKGAIGSFYGDAAQFSEIEFVINDSPLEIKVLDNLYLNFDSIDNATGFLVPIRDSGDGFDTIQVKSKFVNTGIINLNYANVFLSKATANSIPVRYLNRQYQLSVPRNLVDNITGYGPEINPNNLTQRLFAPRNKDNYFDVHLRFNNSNNRKVSFNLIASLFRFNVR